MRMKQSHYSNCVAVVVVAMDGASPTIYPLDEKLVLQLPLLLVRQVAREHCRMFPSAVAAAVLVDPVDETVEPCSIARPT